MLKLLQGAKLYRPAFSGQKDLLIAGQKIMSISDRYDINKLPEDTEIIDFTGKLIVPGFVDSLVHITGGGGEGGFHTRTPELSLSDATTAGITTLVGALGTDATTRSLEGLLAKARALTYEGISCYCHTGSYQFPVKTITGSVRDDIILIPEFIGVGELAIADHRSSHPTLDEMIKISAEARVGGMLSGKKGIVSIHMGDSPKHLTLLEDVVGSSDLPIKQFYPTHINRNPGLVRASKSWLKKGGYVDLTTSTTEMDLDNGESKCSALLAEYLAEGIDVEQISFSSDGHASLPTFDSEGQLKGLKVGLESSLFNEVRESVIKYDVPLEKAIKVITSSPAKILGLENKGKIEEGADADLVILEPENLNIDSVLAKGKIMVKDSQVIVKGTFE